MEINKDPVRLSDVCRGGICFVCVTVDENNIGAPKMRIEFLLLIELLSFINIAISISNFFYCYPYSYHSPNLTFFASFLYCSPYSYHSFNILRMRVRKIKKIINELTPKRKQRRLRAIA